MKILFIDQLCPIGHINYNNHWLKIFKELNIDVELVMSKDYYEKLCHEKGKLKLEIPEKYIQESKRRSKIIREIWLYKIFCFINKNLNLLEYDYILIASFENISLFFANFFYGKNTFAILHNNLKRINNPMIRFIIKKLSENLKLISLDFFIKDKLEKYKIKSFTIINPLPLNKFSLVNKKNKEIFIFSPSKSSIDEKIIDAIIKNKEIEENLKKNNIRLYLRSKKTSYKSARIEVNNSYLDEKEYIDIFNKSQVIFLPYNKNFNLRISAVLLEAFSAEKK